MLRGGGGALLQGAQGMRLLAHLFRTRPADNSQWGMGRTCSLVVHHGTVAGAGSVLRARPVPCLLADLLRIWAELVSARAWRCSWHSFDERRCGHILFPICFQFFFLSLCCGLSFRSRTLDLVSDIGFGLMLCVVRGRWGSVAKCPRDEIALSSLLHQTSR